MSRENPVFLWRPEDFVLDMESDEDFLGAGGCGEVYRARFAPDKSHLLPDYHNEYLALKLVTESRINDRCRKSLQKEADILHQIPVHRNVVTLLGVWLHPKRFALVFEFMNGGSLAELLEDLPDYPWSERLDACRQIACGMNHLHNFRLPVIHMDLSSANVLIDTTKGTRVYKIADFGLSKIRNCISSSTVGSHSGYIGTLRFIAPERLAGRSVDVREYPETAMMVDVYSFGIILYHIKERHLPYEDEINAVIIANVRDGILPPLSDTSCPSGFNELMTKCYHKEAVCRPKFQDVCVALDKLHSDGCVSCEARMENAISCSAYNSDFGPIPGNRFLPQTADNYFSRRLSRPRGDSGQSCFLDSFGPFSRLFDGSEVAIDPEGSTFSSGSTMHGLSDAFLTVGLGRKTFTPEILLATSPKLETGRLTRNFVTVNYVLDFLQKKRKRRSLNGLSNYEEINKSSTPGATVERIHDKNSTAVNKTAGHVLVGFSYFCR